jgi:hypothetical protein
MPNDIITGRKKMKEMLEIIAESNYASEDGFHNRNMQFKIYREVGSASALKTLERKEFKSLDLFMQYCDIFQSMARSLNPCNSVL